MSKSKRIKRSSLRSRLHHEALKACGFFKSQTHYARRAELACLYAPFASYGVKDARTGNIVYRFITRPFNEMRLNALDSSDIRGVKQARVPGLYTVVTYCPRPLSHMQRLYPPKPL